MRGNIPRAACILASAVVLSFFAKGAEAQGWTLIGLSGAQGDFTQNAQGEYIHPDRTLFEINPLQGSASKLFQLTFVTDDHVIGYCPMNGLLYHAAGDASYRNDTFHIQSNQGVPDFNGVGFMDCQYPESVNLATGAATPIFNANPCPNPDTSLSCCGLVAPRPSWVLPTTPRNSTQTDPSYAALGPNEYQEARGLAWSTASNLFYLVDSRGIFTMTTGGDSRLLAQPAFPVDGSTSKGNAIAFVTVTNKTTVWIGHRDGVGNNGYVLQIDPATGAVLGQLALNYPTGGGDPIGAFGGLLGLAQHPETGVIYGVRETFGTFGPELVTIDPLTGNTTLVGNIGTHIGSIAFARTSWRLVGLTGMQADSTLDVNGDFVHPDRTLFEINKFSAASNKLFQMTFVMDGHVIGYCPTNGLIYHAAGDASYGDNPASTQSNQSVPDFVGAGFMDCQYLESFNPANSALSPIFNANPCPNPDPSLSCCGLSAPRPTWVLPTTPRNSSQTDSSFRVVGPNEYHEARGLAWSTTSNLFYLMDEGGIFTLTTSGDSRFLTQPAFVVDGSRDKGKAIAFVTVTNKPMLWIGHRDGVNPNGYVLELNPTNGAVLGELALNYPPGGAAPVNVFNGLLALAQHPETGVIYGVRKTANSFGRELVTINPVTGDTTLVGNIGLHITSIAFVPLPAPLQITSITRNGNDLNITWIGGRPPYQLQTRTSLTTGSWANIGPQTSSLSETVTNGVSGAQGYFRVLGQ